MTQQQEKTHSVCFLLLILLHIYLRMPLEIVEANAVNEALAAKSPAYNIL